MNEVAISIGGHWDFGNPFYGGFSLVVVSQPDHSGHQRIPGEFHFWTSLSLPG
jgi:hypothetical protein